MRRTFEAWSYILLAIVVLTVFCLVFFSWSFFVFSMLGFSALTILATPEINEAAIGLALTLTLTLTLTNPTYSNRDSYHRPCFACVFGDL